MKVVEFISSDGRNPAAIWFAALDPQAAAKVVVALVRIERGNLATVKSVGGGVMEYRIDWGPGYRLYFAREGPASVMLLAGGTKRRQQHDIEIAIARWADHKQRKET